MTDYKSYKKFYSDGDLFTLTGADFYGLVEVENNVAVELGTKKVLTSKNTFDTDLAFSRVFKDRVISDLTIDLPNTIEECTFAINDTFDYNLFKFKLDKIRENTNFIFSRCFIASNKLPWSTDIRYASLTSISDSTFTVQELSANSPTFNDSIPFSNSNKLSAFGDVIESTAQLNLDFNDRFALFAITSSTFIAMTGSDTSLDVILNTNKYEDDDNELRFGELGGIASNKENVFLTDTVNNVVLKYDIEGFINNDSSLGNKRNFIELLGGHGDGRNKTKFIRPTKLACCDTEIAVYDSGNKVIKIFDTMLNYQTRISINFNKETFGAMEFDPDFKSLYILTYGPSITQATGFTAYLYRYSGYNYGRLERVVLEDKIDDDKIVDITFSGVSSNYWFFSTTKQIYKKYKTRPEKVIGTFDNFRLGLIDVQPVVAENNRWNFQDINWKNANFRWNIINTNDASDNGLLISDVNSFNLFPSASGNDRIVMMTNSRIYFFSENTHEAYQRVIKHSNYINYGKQGFSLNKDQYIQTSTINNEITKIVQDVITLKNNIVGRFAGRYNQDILELGDYNYNLNFEEFVREDLENMLIHTNEESLVGVLNRCFSEIYDVQSKITNLVLPDAGSTVQTAYNSQGIILI